MAAEEAGWHEEAVKLCGEEDLMAAMGDRSIFNLDDINLDDIFLDLNDTDIPAFGAADNPPQGGLLSSGNLHGSATEDAPMSVDAPPAAGGDVLSEGLLCDDIDVTQLEWLSNFCEESYSSDSLGFIPCNTGDAAFHISGDDGENKMMGTNVAAAAGAAKEERNFRTSSPISVLEHTGLTVGISPPTSFSTSAITSPSTSSLSSPTSSSCSGIGGGKRDIKMPPEPVIIPSRSRSKRPRPANFSPRPPIVVPLPPSSETPALSANSAAPLGSEEHDNFELVAQANQLEDAESACPNKNKKKKKKALAPATTDGMEAAVTSSPSAAARKCMHCEVTKTPQWRAGPMGPKTLCNACGVRYKSGRLFPEYRPAASPTFVAYEHSNSHKKVVEMRNKSLQDTTETAKPGARRHDVASKACELLEYIRRREWCGDTGIIMSE